MGTFISDIVLQILSFVKGSRSLLKLSTEFQPVNYDTTISGTALVFTRFILLEWLRCKEL